MSDPEKVQALRRQIEQLQQQNRFPGQPGRVDSQGFPGDLRPGESGQSEACADEDQRAASSRSAACFSSGAGPLGHFLGQWVSSGWSELDAILPGGGIRRGSLVEWFARSRPPQSPPQSPLTSSLPSSLDLPLAASSSLSSGRSSSGRSSVRDRRADSSDVWGHGVALAAFRVAWELCRAGGTLVVLDHLDQSSWFYPPTAAAWGVDLERLLWLRVREAREAFWALDQVLRCGAVRAVWCCLGNWDPQLDGRWFRRFQLAAEVSGSVGLFVRSAASRGRPSWAELQLEVTPAHPVRSGEAAESLGALGDVVEVTGQAAMARADRSRLLSIQAVRCRGLAHHTGNRAENPAENAGGNAGGNAGEHPVESSAKDHGGGAEAANKKSRRTRRSDRKVATVNVEEWRAWQQADESAVIQSPCRSCKS